jgi:hypothetical protein
MISVPTPARPSLLPSFNCAFPSSTTLELPKPPNHVDHNPASFSKLISVRSTNMFLVRSETLPSSRPILPKDFNANQPKTIRLYPLSNYTFGTKDGQPEEDPSVLARLKRLEEHYQEHGMRRTCEGVLVCHEHNHPHILMLQIANAFFKLYVGEQRPRQLQLLNIGQTRRLPSRGRR